MSDHDALLAAIIANRADDTPRLAFADYLENDAYPLQPERAEFIRVQCELARIKDAPLPPLPNIEPGPQKCKKCRQWFQGEGLCGCEYGQRRSAKWKQMRWDHNAAIAGKGELRRRERELLESIGHGILGVDWGQVVNESPTITVPVDWHNIGYQFHRGFVAQIKSPWDWWRTHADAILARQPIERVKLTTRPEGWLGLDEDQKAELERRWPGIEFELPSVIMDYDLWGHSIVTVPELDLEETNPVYVLPVSADRG